MKSFPTVLGTTNPDKAREWNAIMQEEQSHGAPLITILDRKEAFLEV